MTAEAFPAAVATGTTVDSTWGQAVTKDAVIADQGTISITPVANTPTSGAITFNKTFPSAPMVVVTAQASVPGTIVTGVGCTAITTTGCLGWVTRTNTTATTLNWVAILTH